MHPRQIASRAKRIGLQHKVIARQAELDGATVYRIFAGRTRPLLDTVSRIERVLIAEEIRLRDHLLQLHPIEERAAE